MKRGSQNLPDVRLPPQPKSQRKRPTQRKRAGPITQLPWIRFVHIKTQPVAEPDLLKTMIVARGRELPGPRSQDDDEDSSPIVQESDRTEHTQCSSNNRSSLMPSRGASAHGSEESPLVTPASPRQRAKLTNSTEKAKGENAKLTKA